MGLLVVLAGAAYGVLQLLFLLQQNSLIRHAFYAGMVAAVATAAGALPALFMRRLSQKLHDVMLGFGAGVMLAACMFSLIVPALTLLADSGASAWYSSGSVALAILLGGAAMLLLERLVPHQHFIKDEDRARNKTLRRSWLFVFAIALHNIPEGLAIGASFAAGDNLAAMALATGISVQDIPEGLVVAMALLAVGYSRTLAVSIAVLSGLTEPLMAIVGAAVLGESSLLLPWGLALAAGAMLFVISHEMIPESHRQGHELAATNGLMLGFVLMLLLDTALS
ncbi:MAG: ZIP family metal transporter [Gammaproteobacteria bacterium]|nr:ZIP family metal transporter [Gammaproteobacteria bacterium]MBU1555015.1 ZIP family metal transporter [Gammaproteobacteria bacterium]MBU2071016.1 ZIP family metal transporter [Gammaproteobacteria bacterium]MBU2184284.1 ZIP family metal transporter [Gammaproteobacteria bacterium]MBU2206459.1 ZIP family metal transporter [Gammaproteobacteria bacterium]